jgi:glycosyltransferase involved in cell wall biosynthesis
MLTKPRIYAFHLLNDRSGSPKVLSQIIRGWQKDGVDVHLCTSLHLDGFLSDLEGVTYHHIWYRFKSNPWLRLVFFSLSQVLLFVKMYSRIRKQDIMYVNTVLPFGAALLGKIKGCRVMYHVHESTVNPRILKWFLFKVLSWTASEIINVSDFVGKSHSVIHIQNHVVYNSLDEGFFAGQVPKNLPAFPRNVLMACSLKAYKGVFEFVQLARDFKEYSFRLVLNAQEQEILKFLKGTEIPVNLQVYPSQKDMHPFFQWADLVVNLSLPDAWIETFGLTIIEGMAYGLPAIVPPVGGILEVVEPEATGLLADARDREALNRSLPRILEDRETYVRFSKASSKRLELFREAKMLSDINNILFNTPKKQFTI